MDQNKKIIFLILIIILLLGLVSGYLLIKSGKIILPYSSNTPAATQDDTKEPTNANCTQGVNGNSGNNFCSNYHELSSKCQPNSSNIYPDGCTKK